MSTDEQAQSLRREIEQLRAYYFHCMDYRIYDAAEETRLKLISAGAALAALSV